MNVTLKAIGICHVDIIMLNNFQSSYYRNNKKTIH